MGQKTNPIGNRLGSSEDGILTGLEVKILVIKSLKIIKSEDTLRQD